MLHVCSACTSFGLKPLPELPTEVWARLASSVSEVTASMQASPSSSSKGTSQTSKASRNSDTLGEASNARSLAPAVATAVSDAKDSGCDARETVESTVQSILRPSSLNRAGPLIFKHISELAPVQLQFICLLVLPQLKRRQGHGNEAHEEPRVMTFNRIRSNNGTVNMLPTSANTVLTRTAPTHANHKNTRTRK